MDRQLFKNGQIYGCASVVLDVIKIVLSNIYIKKKKKRKQIVERIGTAVV